MLTAKMDINFEKTYYESENTLWWGRTRRELIVHWISKLPKDAVILDIGCSSGALLTDLSGLGYHDLHGIDVSENAVALARERGHRKTQVMDGGSINFCSETFDVVIASDCLEHIENDKAALHHWYSVLKPGGTLIVFVPAFMYLWSAHDVGNHHCRRYSNKQLTSLVRMSGFNVQRRGYWNFFLFPGVALLRLFQRLLPISRKKVYDVYQPPALVNRALVGLMHIENKLLEYIDLPIGISTYVVAQRPDLEARNGER